MNDLNWKTIGVSVLLALVLTLAVVAAMGGFSQPAAPDVAPELAGGTSNFDVVEAEDFTATDDVTVGDDLTVADDLVVGYGDLLVGGDTYTSTGAITITGVLSNVILLYEQQ